MILWGEQRLERLDMTVKAKIFEIVSTGLLLSVFITFLATFIVAFINGGRITIDINLIGEAHYELVMLSVIFVCGIITIVRQLRRLRYN